jgi:hypothetical protein
MTEQELIHRRSLYWRALTGLYRADQRWYSNYSMFDYWPDDKRDWWIDSIELKAKTGLPMAEQIIAEVVRLRMTR